jgi:membrane protease subunit HflK
MRYLWIALLLVLLGSLLTAVTQVRPGERAVVRRFGRVLEYKPRPGLWIGLPWGMDQVDRVPVDVVRRVTVGFDPNGEDSTSLAGQLLTADHNLVNIQVVIDYGVIEDQVEKYVIARDRVDGLVTRTVESILAEWVAGRSVDAVLLNGKALLPPVLVEETQKRINPYELGVQVKHASVALLSPPEQVRADFEKVNQAQTEIQTKKFKAEQERSQRLGQADSEKDRILREAEAFAFEQRQLALTDAANFEKRLKEYRRFKATNPDYLHDIWFNEIKKVYARMLENGGRVEPLDKLLGRDGMDIIQVPIQRKK